MADVAFGSVEKIVKLALAIREAVKTVRQNQEECIEIERCVTRCSALLARVEEKTEMRKDAVTRDVLDDMTRSLQKALELVTECQKKHWVVSHLWKAGDVAKELRRVQDDIVRKLLMANFATNLQATVVVTDIQNNLGAPPPLPPPHREEAIPGFTQFSFHELRTATNDFSDDNCIGKGGFAEVYKGELHYGQVVAIKKLFPSAFFGDYNREIYNEINVFLNLSHQNIIRPLGYCHEITMNLVKVDDKYVGAEVHHFCFVEEYAPNRTVGSIIYSEAIVGWSSCFKIIQGIAHGVNYLHEQHVVHMDVKPENIMLDSDMNPRIGDFGLAVRLDCDLDESITHDSIRGTMGYLAPEYMEEGIVSTKCDVFAFGATLIQIIDTMSRRPYRLRDLINNQYKAAEGCPDAELRVLEALRPLEEWLDPSLCDKFQEHEVERCVRIALMCKRYVQRERPSMADVVAMLPGCPDI